MSKTNKKTHDKSLTDPDGHDDTFTDPEWTVGIQTMAKSEVLDEMAHNIMSHLIWNYIVSLSCLDLACLLT